MILFYNLYADHFKLEGRSFISRGF